MMSVLLLLPPVVMAEYEYLGMYYRVVSTNYGARTSCLTYNGHCHHLDQVIVESTD